MATPGGGCSKDCQYRLREEINEACPVPPDEVVDGVKYWVVCDFDRINLEAADMLDRLMEDDGK